MLTFKMCGIEELQERLRELSEGVSDELEPEVEQLLAEIEAESQEAVPVDTGVLKASVYTELREDSEGRIRAVIGYDTDYALIVHESPEGEGWKFLESPLVQSAPSFRERVGAAVRRLIARTFR